MKKILAISLVVVMMAALAISAFAETKTDTLSQTIEVGQPALTNQEYSQNITITNTVTYSEATVYAVDIVWTNTAIEVETTVTKTWNPATHSYTENPVTTWGADDKVTVTVTNHSNAAVKATLTAPVVTNDITFTPDKTEATIATAVDTARDAAPADTFTITPSGNTTVATINAQATVTITAG